MFKRLFGVTLVLAALGLVVGCSSGDQEEVEFFGEFFLDSDFDKADRVSNAPAIPTSADTSSTAVWAVYNDWGDTDTAAARQAGLAWDANSGLNWNDKYALWIASMPKIDTEDGYYKTLEITNPQGKTIPAPVLECAEVAYFLRATFAAWYNLPYMLQAIDSTGTRVFMGHFGWRTVDGRYKNSNLFKSWYQDYSGGSYTAANWPEDAKLRGKKLYGSDDDYQPFLEAGARAGTYFDEMFLNKRVGHFLILMLSNFGSIHLADSSNTFNIKPEALREGDVLLERWQRRGIGHTLVVKVVKPGITEGKLVAELVSGSMPRRQPKWENDVASKRYFTMEETGGEGTNYDGEEYAKLGGGIKRWRVARAQSGYYVNTMLPEDVDNWVSSTNYTAIAARPDQFEELLEEVSPDQKRDAVLAIIEDKRAHLRRYPASCSARINREGAFEELYELMEDEFYTNRAEVDRRYRKFEDYVFAELVYQESKTCCWNSSTSNMYEIAMELAEKTVREAGSCAPPPIFMNNNGYGLFQSYAESIGRGHEWVAWSADESCPQSGVAVDLEEEHLWVGFCTIVDELLPPLACTTDGDCNDGVACTMDSCDSGQCRHTPDHNQCAAGETCDAGIGCVGGGGCTDDAYEQNDSLEEAAAISEGSFDGLMICADDEDWFVVSGPFTASISFTHANGDLDMTVMDASGTTLDDSQGMGDSETVQVDASGDLFVQIYGYSSAENGYSLTVTGL